MAKLSWSIETTAQPSQYSRRSTSSRSNTMTRHQYVSICCIQQRYEGRRQSERAASRPLATSSTTSISKP